MARHPRVFSRLYVAMVEAGEAAGILDTVLDRVAVQIEKETAIKRRVKGAMIYPTLVMCFAFLVLAGMLMFLVPIFEDIFQDLQGELPMLTQYVVNASNFLRNEWMFFFPACAAVFFGIRKLKRTEVPKLERKLKPLDKALPIPGGIDPNLANRPRPKPR
jgi:type IV pilus assembly protein PilC